MTNLQKTEDAGRVGSTGTPLFDVSDVTLIVCCQADGAWTDSVAAMGGNVYHTQQWGNILKKDGKRPLYFRWTDGEGCTRGLALGAESSSDRPILRKLTRQLQFESYPLAVKSDSVTVQRLISDIKTYALKERYSSCLIESYCARSGIVDLESLGFNTDYRIEFHLDLRKSIEELWGGVSESHRRKIRKAERSELSIKVESSHSALRHMRKLQTDSTNRRLTRGEAMPVQADSHYELLGSGYLDEGIGRVVLAYEGDEPVSAAFMTVFGKEALYVWGGSSDRGFATNAPALLFWRAIEELKKQGVSVFNFGGVPASAKDPGTVTHGLYRFKAGFGCERVTLATGRLADLRPVVSRVLKIARRLAGR